MLERGGRLSNTEILVLYVLPAMICILSFGYVTYKEYKRDLGREKHLDFYVNKLTWGDIVLRLTVSLIPLINMFAILHIYADKIGSMFDKSCNILSKPVVSNSKRASENLDLPK